MQMASWRRRSEVQTADPSSTEDDVKSTSEEPSEQVEKTEPDKRQKLASKGKAKTNGRIVPVQRRNHAHKFVIRRPRALQVAYHGQIIEAGPTGKVDLEAIRSGQTQRRSSQESSGSAQSEGADKEGERRSTDDIEQQRERLDLFIDLLWIGIISNISENFFNRAFDENRGSWYPVLEFIALFMPAWSIWCNLQVFLNSYYMDDLVQRFFITWILILGLIWGNNAPYLLLSESRTSLMTASYIVATCSIRLLELVYSIWLPWTRRSVMLNIVFTLPLAGLWLGASTTTGWVQFGLVYGAIAIMLINPFIEATPSIDRLYGDGIRRTRDYKHIIKRYEDFFIIAVGEGVFLLIRGSPLGTGLSPHLSRGVLALLIFYSIHWQYFNGDQSREYIHPVYRRWWIRELWYFMHIPLFMATVLLSSALLYLVDFEPDGESNGVPATESEIDGSASTTHYTLRTAIVASFASLAVIFLSQIVLALLCKPRDPPGTLFIGSRYVRLAGRTVGLVILATLWNYGFSDPTTIIGTLATICMGVFVWEWHAGLEHGGGWLEPKED